MITAQSRAASRASGKRKCNDHGATDAVSLERGGGVMPSCSLSARAFFRGEAVGNKEAGPSSSRLLPSARPCPLLCRMKVGSVRLGQAVAPSPPEMTHGMLRFWPLCIGLV